MKMNMMLFKPHLSFGHDKPAEMAIWSAQTLLALVFILAGYMKISMSPADLAMSMPWTSEVPLNLVRFIGIAEMLGALGVMLPSLTRIQPQLTSIASSCLVMVMMLATVFHLSRGEYAYMPIPMILGCLAAIVSWARGIYSPIEPR